MLFCRLHFQSSYQKIPMEINYLDGGMKELAIQSKFQPLINTDALILYNVFMRFSLQFLVQLQVFPTGVFNDRAPSIHSSPQTPITDPLASRNHPSFLEEIRYIA